MKRKAGFVSNSSSSSYVCDICGETQDECGKVSWGWCAHSYCNTHADGVPDDDLDPNIPDAEQRIERSKCLICRGLEFSNEDVLTVLEIMAKRTRDSVRAEMAEKWARNYGGLTAYINENRIV